MNCPNCQFENPSGMKFCGDCGARLARLCAQCGVESPPGFRFCGECGAPVAQPGASGTPAAGPEPAAAGPKAVPAATVAPVAPVTASAPITAAAATAPAIPALAVPAPATPAAAAAMPERATLRSGTEAQPYTPPHLAEQVLRSRAAFDGERKQVTVLFCDLVSSTALADRIGPEAMHRLLRRFFELALGEVHRYGGTINQFLGDGFMALFGAPVAHEDHARRAVRAALAVRRELEDQRLDIVAAAASDSGGEAAGELAVRMGLNTGWVVVGGIGDHLRMDYTAVGDTTNVAARLQQLAAPGAILVSDATRALVEDEVALEPMTPAMVKGKTQPIRTFQLLGAGGQAGRPQLGQRTLTPLVGRQHEADLLLDLVDLAAAGRGQVIGIAGEAGAGKSRLVLELRQRLLERRITWLRGRCLSYGEGVPYLPLLHLLRDAWGIAESDPKELVTAKAAAGLEQFGVAGSDAEPYLLALLGLRTGAAALAESGSQAIQNRTFAALRQLILRATQRCLVVVEIEDLHWVDPTSEEFLASLVEDLAGAGLLLLTTYRSGYRPAWLEKSYASQIGLRPLSTSQSRELVDAVLRRLDVPVELTTTIIERAEGNPFFLEELTRTLEERVGEGGGILVPDTVQGVLMARIDRLPEEHKRLLQTAAILGRELPRGLLEAMWQDGEALDPLLHDLKRWEFFQEVPAAEGRNLFVFRHALTQEAVYQSLLTTRRQALHGVAGRALETLFAGRLEEAYAGLAYHFPQANEPEKAVEYLALSADAYAGSYAHPEAAKALEEALRQAERLPAAERDARLVELALRLARSLLPLARFPETLELCLRHQERAETLEESDASLAGRFHFWLAHTYSYLGDQEHAAASAERAIGLAERCGDEITLAKAHYVLARDGFWSGQFALGVDHSLRAVSLLERHGERWWQGQAYWVAGFNQYALGQFDAALDSMARARAIGEVLADPRLDTSWSTGYFYASMGEWEAAIRDCSGGLERSRDPLNSTAALGFLGHAYLQQGEPRRAVESLEPAVEGLRRAGFRQLLGWFLAFLAESYLGIGRVAQARLLAQESLGLARETRFAYGAGLAQRALGSIARQSGTSAEALSWLEQSLTTFTDLEAPFEIARTSLDLAALHLTLGDRDAAEHHLDRATTLFRTLNTPRYLQRANQLATDLADSWLEEAAGGCPCPTDPPP